VESGRPEDRARLSGRPHDDLLSFSDFSALGLGGGLSCRGNQNLVICSIKRGHDGKEMTC
jgi:hypothetical protein